MLESNIFDKVLYVGIDYIPPRGGIASVLNTYSTFIYPFKFVKTTASDLNGIKKLWYAIRGYFIFIYKILVDHDIKIVHIHSASGNSFWRKSWIIKIAKIMRKRVIFHCHGGGFKDFRSKFPEKVDAILNYVDSVVCLSNEWKDYFESIGCQHVVIVKNVIPEPIIQIEEKDNLVHFLFLGLICENKGIFDVLKSLAEHKDFFLGRAILHVGGNGQTDRLLSTIKELGLQELVRFEGWVDAVKKQYLFNTIDVYILPSYIEGVPISILEAESYHKPIITTNVGGIPSIVKENKTGLFVTPGNTGEIFEAMKLMLEDKQLRYQFGEAGYKISIDYRPESICRELKELYENLL